MTSQKFLPVMFIFVCAISSAASAVTYSWSDKATGCDCKSVSAGTLTSADLDQSQASQDAAWETFKTAYPGLVDLDRLFNRTYTYNCHAAAYGFMGWWIEDISKFKGTTIGCWEQVATGGSIKSSLAHSCTVGNVGKCGAWFHCANNQHVYGPSMPTTRYRVKLW